MRNVLKSPGSSHISAAPRRASGTVFEPGNNGHIGQWCDSAVTYARRIGEASPARTSIDSAMRHHRRLAKASYPPMTHPISIVRRVSRACAAVSLACVLTPVFAADALPPDVKGGHDSPIIQRFAGSWMIGYGQKEYDQAIFPESLTVKDGKWVAPSTVEGKVTKFFYLSPRGKSPLEVFRNYQQSLVAAGFKPKVVCEKDCADFYWATRKTSEFAKGMAYASGSLSALGAGNYSLTGGVVVPSNGRFWYGTLPRNGQDVHVMVYTSDAENDQTGIASTFVEIVEPKAMQTGQVKVDANAMEKGLQTAGRIALYGLYFDTGRADIKPESKPQLDEMAKLLQAQPALKVYIVGHTDNQGTLDANRTLSTQRAQAVIAALARDYKIDAKRMVAGGVASLAPLASNDAEDGRAQNRRVELVKQ